jgi:hypothetical protein
MDTEAGVVTFVVRLAQHADGRIVGIVERVRSGEKRRFRGVEAIGPLIAAMLQDRVEGEG